MTEQPSNAGAEASNWSDVMAKVIEFYLSGPAPKKVKPVPTERRGMLVDSPKGKFGAQSTTEDIAERGEVRPSTILLFGCF